MQNACKDNVIFANNKRAETLMRCFPHQNFRS